MSNQTRTRAVSEPGTDVGSMRYGLYKQAYAQVNKAIKEGFYLEAITLIESLTSDRLESRISCRMGKDFSFKTLGSLIKELRDHESDPELKRLVDEDLDKWRQARNKALHEMVKLEQGDSGTWEERTAELIPVAEDGLTILRAIDRRHKALLRPTQT